MNRRNFLGMMIGGLATAAAVRTFPFRVYSFPKEIDLSPLPVPDSVTFNQHYIHLGKDGVWKVDSVGSHLLSIRPLDGLPWYADNWTGDFQGIARCAGPFATSREIEIEEAKRIFPGPFRWQDGDRIRRSVLCPDGSVVDA